MPAVHPTQRLERVVVERHIIPRVIERCYRAWLGHDTFFFGHCESIYGLHFLDWGITEGIWGILSTRLPPFWDLAIGG